MRKKICLVFILLFFTCLCCSCSSPKDCVSIEERLKIDLEGTYNVNEDVPLTISVGLASERSKPEYSDVDTKGKPMLGYAPIRHGKTILEDKVVLHTFTDLSDDRYYYTEEENGIIYHFSEQYVIPRDFFNDTYYLHDIYGGICVFLCHPTYSPTSPTDYDENVWSGSMYSEYVYEKQGETLLIQNKRSYPYLDYSLKIDLEESYNLNEDVSIMVSMGIHPRFDCRYQSGKGYLKLVYEKAYTIEGFTTLYYEDPTTIYTFTDLSDYKYFFTREKNEIIYHFREQFIIDKDVFNNTTRNFRIYLIYSNSNDDYSNRVTTMLNYTYEKQGETLLISFVGCSSI